MNMEIDNIIIEASTNQNGIIWTLANNITVYKKMYMDECRKYEEIQERYEAKQKDFLLLQEKFNASDKGLDGA